MLIAFEVKTSHFRICWEVFWILAHNHCIVFLKIHFSIPNLLISLFPLQTKLIIFPFPSLNDHIFIKPTSTHSIYFKFPFFKVPITLVFITLFQFLKLPILSILLSSFLSPNSIHFSNLYSLYLTLNLSFFPLFPTFSEWLSILSNSLFLFLNFHFHFPFSFLLIPLALNSF